MGTEQLWGACRCQAGESVRLPETQLLPGLPPCRCAHWGLEKRGLERGSAWWMLSAPAAQAPERLPALGPAAVGHMDALHPPTMCSQAGAGLRARVHPVCPHRAVFWWDPPNHEKMTDSVRRKRERKRQLQCKGVVASHGVDQIARQVSWSR